MASPPRVLICDKLSQRGVEILTQSGFEVDDRSGISAKELLAIVGDYNAVIVRSRTKLTKEAIDKAKNLRIIGRAGAGLDNIDLEAADANEIEVLNTREAATNAVAELAIGLMFSLARKIHFGDASIRRGEWNKDALMGFELNGKTLGVIGLGGIGTRTARIAKGIGMKIVVSDKFDISKEVLAELESTQLDLDELLRVSDIVTPHVPLDATTRHMIDGRRLSLMKRSAFLVNTSRGAVVDEEALYHALSSGGIAGAALDVFEAEPPLESKITSLQNVVLTPHIGAQTFEAQELAASRLAEKIVQAYPKHKISLSRSNRGG